jgi:hypothetical protein
MMRQGEGSGVRGYFRVSHSKSSQETPSCIQKYDMIVIGVFE